MNPILCLYISIVWSISSHPEFTVEMVPRFALVADRDNVTEVVDAQNSSLSCQDEEAIGKIAGLALYNEKQLYSSGVISSSRLSVRHCLPYRLTFDDIPVISGNIALMAKLRSAIQKAEMSIGVLTDPQKVAIICKTLGIAFCVISVKTIRSGYKEVIQDELPLQAKEILPNKLLPIAYGVALYDNLIGGLIAELLPTLRDIHTNGIQETA